MNTIVADKSFTIALLMSTHLIELVERLAGRKVALIGDLMLDKYLYGDAERLSPDAPVPVLQYRKEEARLGGAGRVAADLATLGASVRVVPATMRILSLLPCMLLTRFCPQRPRPAMAALIINFPLRECCPVLTPPVLTTWRFPDFLRRDESGILIDARASTNPHAGEDESRCLRERRVQCAISATPP